ncbi:hypothetical protein R6Z07F_015348 [Ovis aries]
MGEDHPLGPTSPTPLPPVVVAPPLLTARLGPTAARSLLCRLSGPPASAAPGLCPYSSPSVFQAFPAAWGAHPLPPSSGQGSGHSRFYQKTTKVLPEGSEPGPQGTRAKDERSLNKMCLLPLFSWQPVDAVQVEQLLGKLTPALGHLDQELLAARPLLAPGQVSLEDLMAFTELMQPAAIGCDLFRDWPRLAAWRARVEAALGPELVQEAHSRVLQPQETQGDPQMAQKLAQQVKEQLR